MKDTDVKHMFPPGGGEMGALTRAKDWSTNPVGPVETWPQSLRTALSIVLNSRFPMFLWWGPELICFYNDAYRPSLGINGKHPSILGMKAEEAWPEIWDIIKPLIDQVTSRGEATWSEDQLIPIYRNGKIEDVYWTFSYSPVHDESNEVAGIMVICSETTEKVNTLEILKESNRRYQNDIMQAPVAMCIFRGKDHVVEIVNDRMLEIFGKTLSEVNGKPIFEGLPEAKGQGLEIMIDGVFTTGEKFVGSERAINLPRNGKVVTTYISFVCEALKDPDGRISGVAAIASEVTAQVLARQKIEESESRFRAIADSAPVLIWMAGTDKLFNFFNKAWLNYTNRTIEEESGNGWTEGIHPEDRHKYFDSYLAAFERHEEFYIEYRFKRHDGKYRWVSDTGVPRITSDGLFEGYIGACMDIHDSVVSQKELEYNQERLNIVISASDLAIWELNVKTNEVNYSERYLEILGYRKDTQLTHEQILKHLHPEDLHIRQKAFQEAFVTGYLHYNSRIIWNDKSVHWMESRGKVFYDEENNPLKLIGTTRDITDEKNYQQQLEEREQKFRLLADSMPQHVWTGDADGNLNYFNQSVFDYSGITPEQVYKEGWIQIVHPDDRLKNIREWANSVNTGKDFLLEHRFRRHDGVYRWQLSRAIPQKDANGNTQMWVGTSTDIEDQKTFTNKLEKQIFERTRELEQKNSDLEKMNAELESFAYVSSHDMQEPLRKIQTFATRIIEKEEQNLSESGKDYFRRMQEAAKRMQTLIEDLLAYSRTSTSERLFKTMNLGEIISEVKADFKEIIAEDQVVIEIEMDRMYEASIIPFQFRQLVHNLVSNSIKFAKEGVPPRIKIKSKIIDGRKSNVATLLHGKKYCHLSLSDNGIGFDPQYKDRIFEVFQRLHGKSEYKGTGIGLAIVKKIVENHNGVITASGELNKGATFDIYIPVYN